MKPALADVIARAKGLGTHLLAPPDVEQLAASRSLSALAAQLSRAGYPAELGQALTVAELDRIVAGVAAARLNLLARWLGHRCDVLRALFEGREVAVLRAVVRGIAEGAAPAARLRGLGPTPWLPAPVLARVAAADSIAALHRMLLQAGHPGAGVLARARDRSDRDDLLRVELGLRQWWAERIRNGARRAGREARRLAADTIDRENLVALLLGSGWGVEVAPEDLFLPGGTVLSRELFRSVAGEADPELRRGALARAFGRTAMGRVLANPGVSLSVLPRELLAATITVARREAAQRPLGLAPVVEVVLRIEAEARNVRRALHAVALEAPASHAMAGMVAAA